MFELKDKVVLITGATGGIGGAIARKMKEAGATVVVSGRNTAKLDSEFDDSYVKIPADLSAEARRLNWLWMRLKNAVGWMCLSITQELRRIHYLCV
jgi:3-oxoacyl-[acyl-carrier protein] reductase